MAYWRRRNNNALLLLVTSLVALVTVVRSDLRECVNRDVPFKPQEVYKLLKSHKFATAFHTSQGDVDLSIPEYGLRDDNDSNNSNITDVTDSDGSDGSAANGDGDEEEDKEEEGEVVVMDATAEDKEVFTRVLRYMHPVKSKFPGVPPLAKTQKEQTIRVYLDEGGAKDGAENVYLHEHTTVDGVPYSTSFTIHTHWNVTALPNGQGSNVRVGVELVFTKRCMVRSMIESSTHQEYGEAIQDMVNLATEWLKAGALDGSSSGDVDVEIRVRDDVGSSNGDDDDATGTTSTSTATVTSKSSDNGNDNDVRVTTAASAAAPLIERLMIVTGQALRVGEVLSSSPPTSSETSTSTVSPSPTQGKPDLHYLGIIEESGDLVLTKGAPPPGGQITWRASESRGRGRAKSFSKRVKKIRKRMDKAKKEKKKIGDTGAEGGGEGQSSGKGGIQGGTGPEFELRLRDDGALEYVIVGVGVKRRRWLWGWLIRGRRRRGQSERVESLWRSDEDDRGSRSISSGGGGGAGLGVFGRYVATVTAGGQLVVLRESSGQTVWSSLSRQ